MGRKTEWQTEGAVAVIRKFVPEFNIKNKIDSKLHHAIACLMRFTGNDEYMMRFWTTIGYTAWKPNSDQYNYPTVVFHEGRHALQSKKLTRPLMGFLYLAPQILTPFLCLALGMIEWYLFPIGLLLLAPIPAYFRMLLELDAYAVSMAVDYWRSGFISEKYVDWYIMYFTGPQYYIMWPFKNDLRKRFLKKREEIINGTVLLNDDYLKAIYDHLVSEGIVKV